MIATFSDKDVQRIEDIVTKGKSTFGEKTIRLAESMANRIGSSEKALCRARAATDQNFHTIALVFYNRARVLQAQGK
jgi:hypothetical protein